jgi:hypothetical protein
MTASCQSQLLLAEAVLPRRNCACDASLGHHRRLTSRAPLTAIENHSARRAGVRDDGEPHMPLLDVDRVARRIQAICGRVREPQYDLGGVESPPAAHRGPSLACKGECAVSMELRREHAEGERRVRNGHCRLSRTHNVSGGRQRNQKSHCQHGSPRERTTATGTRTHERFTNYQPPSTTRLIYIDAILGGLTL